MRNATLTLLAASLLVVAMTTGVAAQQQAGLIELNLTAEKEIQVVNDKGVTETQRVPAAKVIPNDKVIYTISYTNVGNEQAENVFITNPVPEHMLYLNGTANGNNTEVTYSIDGGQTFDLAQNLKVTLADGTTRLAIATDYTHIRWTLKNKIAPEEKGVVSFWAQLE
jgi:uncharacterized repeat protein (TIGR01451 family)